MSKKDYILIAGVVQNFRQLPGLDIEYSERLTEMFCRVLAGDNPRFDEWKFSKACLSE